MMDQSSPDTVEVLRDMRTPLAIKAADEIVRLRTENWQLKQACGYPIPADKETINNPFKCGICDARSSAGISEAMQLADEYEAGLRKMEAVGYEEFFETIPKHKLIIKALRALAQGPSSTDGGSQ